VLVFFSPEIKNKGRGQKKNLPRPKNEERLPLGRPKKEDFELLCLPCLSEEPKSDTRELPCLPPLPPPKKNDEALRLWRDSRDGERDRDRERDFLFWTVYLVRPLWDFLETMDTLSLSQNPILIFFFYFSLPSSLFWMLFFVSSCFAPGKCERCAFFGVDAALWGITKLRLENNAGSVICRFAVVGDCQQGANAFD